ncbi:MAG: lipoprotein-releasing ABC transporter ATP-binding protein LolD [Gammaproteobacteria bacterium]
MNNSSPVLTCTDLAKTFVDGQQRITVLKAINLTVYPCESIAIVGASGEGKSTLLHLLGGLDRADTGCVQLADKNINAMSEKKRCQWRNRHLGFIYQFHHLLPEFNALENVAMPLLLRRDLAIAEIKQRAQNLLEQVGLAQRTTHKIGQLSGGERQRIAIARALVTQPKCVLADEPTGNLDHRSAEKVYQTMLALKQTMQTSFVVVTHDLSLARQMDRVLHLTDGVLIED